MNNKNFYDQLLAINNTLQLESETRKLDKKNNDPDADFSNQSDFRFGKGCSFENFV